MPGESAEYDLIRVLDSDSSSKADTFFIAPKEIGRSGSGLQVLTVESVGEPDAPDSGQSALFLDSSGAVKSKAPDGTVSGVGESLDPATTDIDQFKNSNTKADLTQAGGVLVNSQVPQLSITSVTTVPDQTARLNLTAQEGDVAVQTDTGEAYVLSTDDPTVDSNWIEISIDVLSQIDGQQITPAQVGTSTNRTNVTADTVDTNNLTGVSTGGAATVTRAFLSTASSSNPIPFDAIDFDPDSNFNTGNHEYTVPTNGTYRITAVAQNDGSQNRLRLSLRVNGIEEALTFNDPNSAFGTASVTATLELLSGDLVDIENPDNRTVNDGSAQTYFEAVRLQ